MHGDACTDADRFVGLPGPDRREPDSITLAIAPEIQTCFQGRCHERDKAA